MPLCTLAASVPPAADTVATSSSAAPVGPTDTSGFSSTPDTAVSGPPLAQVTVTAERLQLQQTASTASEGIVSVQELQLSPIYRPGQLLETVPGLIVTSHSGEGKANQYLMRGYNLDHGTDLETYVDGMPINQPTHAHGQGYTDLNFMIPELVDQVSYTKGPYYANVGDFGGVGSVRVDYANTIAPQAAVSAGTLGYRRVFGADSAALGGGNLLGAAELQHYDGPFENPDDARKQNSVLRYSRGDERNGYTLTGMYYHQLWNNTTDIPVRAITEGLLPNRFGTFNPSDGGRAQRASLSMQYRATPGSGQLAASSYFIYNQLHIYNDFTHYLVNPIDGDQEDQFENRRVYGGEVQYTLPLRLGPFESEFLIGALTRYDLLGVGRLPSEERLPLSVQDEPPSYSDLDQVYLSASAAYAQVITHWSPTLQSVLGFREDYQHGTDVDYLAALHESAGYTNGGTAAQALPQPKGSLIYSPVENLAFYLSAGVGFHSADLRGVNQDTSVDLGLPHTPLLAQQDGEEVGVRAEPRRNLALTFAVYNLWQQSETIIDPDVGQDVAGPPSRRYGFELNFTYQIRRWLEFYGSYSGNHARFTHPFDDGTGHLGNYITDAPVASGSASLYLTALGPWSAGLDYRYLGAYALSSGPCVNVAAAHDFPGVSSCATAPTAAGQVNGQGFGELDLAAHYAFQNGWRASLGVYNVLDTRASAAEFWYVDRLRSEIVSYPDGRADIHEHPLEPLMARFTIAWSI
ncbi:MAG TPA: TonB-dependent receptor [Steroidobacteraceae bacterium]|nr:TonB-dependent receptor [Steroidobacteraceae bacterium]